MIGQQIAVNKTLVNKTVLVVGLIGIDAIQVCK